MNCSDELTLVLCDSCNVAQRSCFCSCNHHCAVQHRVLLSIIPIYILCVLETLTFFQTLHNSGDNLSRRYSSKRIFNLSGVNASRTALHRYSMGQLVIACYD